MSISSTVSSTGSSGSSGSVSCVLASCSLHFLHGLFVPTNNVDDAVLDIFLQNGQISITAVQPSSQLHIIDILLAHAAHKH